jgi:hypothetical protein
MEEPIQYQNMSKMSWQAQTLAVPNHFSSQEVLNESLKFLVNEFLTRKLAVPYEDQNDGIFHAYYDDNQRTSQLPKPDTNDFDYLQHAIADARKMLLATMMPWTKEEADLGLVFLGPWTESRYFHFVYFTDENSALLVKTC